MDKEIIYAFLASSAAGIVDALQEIYYKRMPMGWHTLFYLFLHVFVAAIAGGVAALLVYGFTGNVFFMGASAFLAGWAGKGFIIFSIDMAKILLRNMIYEKIDKKDSKEDR